MVSLKSLQETDCVVLAGSNASYNHPRLMNELIKLRNRGGKVIVINPVKERGLVKFVSPAFMTSLLTGSDIASIYLQPIPGSDVALFTGIQKSLIEQDKIDREFLQAHTENWSEVISYARSTQWSTITEICGVDRVEIEAYDAQALIEAADRGKVDTLICVGGNLYGASPNSHKVKRAFSKIKTIIYLATKPNLGHFHGLAAEQTIIIPIFNRFENPHKTTVESGNNFVRLNNEAPETINTSEVLGVDLGRVDIAHTSD